MPTNELIRKHLKFIDLKDPLLIAYTLGEYANGDSWKEILVIFNGEGKEKNFALNKPYKILLNGESFDFALSKVVDKSIKIPSFSAVILVDDDKVWELLTKNKNAQKANVPKTEVNSTTPALKNYQPKPTSKVTPMIKSSKPESRHESIQLNTSILTIKDSLYVHYFKSHNPLKDGWSEMMVLINHSSKEREYVLDHSWKLYFNSKKFFTKEPSTVNRVMVPPKSSYILVQPKKLTNQQRTSTKFESKERRKK